MTISATKFLTTNQRRGKNYKLFPKRTGNIFTLVKLCLKIFPKHLDMWPEFQAKMTMAIPNIVNLSDLVPKEQVSPYLTYLYIPMQSIS